MADPPDRVSQIPGGAPVPEPRYADGDEQIPDMGDWIERYAQMQAHFFARAAFPQAAGQRVIRERE